MKKNPYIPSHSYSQTEENRRCVDDHMDIMFDPEIPFILTKFEIMNELAQADYPHRHDCFQVLYILEGEGAHIIDFEPHEIKTPMLFFLSKEQIHFWKIKKPLKGYILLFPEEFLGFPSSNIIREHDFSVFHYVLKEPFLSIKEKNQTAINELLKEVELEFNNKNTRSLSVLRAYLHILLTKVHRLYMINHPEEKTAIMCPLTHQFKQLVSKHFIEEHTVQEYANRIGISTSHLKDTIKAVTGYAPSKLIHQQLILEAKRSLVHSNLTVAEIGYRLNFEDSSYFGRFFKRETGLSPVTFRNQAQEKYNISPE